MSFLNRLPEALSQSRFLSLLSAYSRCASPPPGFFLLLDNYKTHYSAYQSMPALQAEVLKTLRAFAVRPAIWSQIQPKLPSDLATRLSPRRSVSGGDFQSYQSYSEHSFCLYVEEECRQNDERRVAKAMQSVVSETPRMSMWAVCRLLEIIAREKVAVPKETLWALEARIGSTGHSLRLSGFNMIVKSLNAKNFYGRVSATFWRQLAEKMIAITNDNFPAGLCLNYCRKAFFHSPELFSRLIPLWRRRAERGLLDEFKEGLMGVALSPFSTAELLVWGETRAVAVKSDLRSFDLVNILRVLMVNQQYTDSVWRELLAECGRRPLCVLDKLSLFSALRGLELDNPACASSLLSLNRRLYDEVQSTFKLYNQPRRVSDSEEELGKFLSSLGISFERLKPMLSLYTSDFFIPSCNLAVEFTGGPFHISQVDNSLDCGTQAKLRHLQRNGFHVVVVSELESFPQKMKKAMAILSTASQPTLLGIVGKTTGANFTRLVSAELIN